MESISLTYERLLQQFTEWARSQADIQAAFVVGSRARLNSPANEWSDLDITVFVTQPGGTPTNGNAAIKRHSS